MPVYLDYNATTPLDPRVVEAMLPFLGTHFGNPSSDHVYGRAASGAISEARAEVATLIGAAPEEIVFTGCATEANNQAILGAARAARNGGRGILVTSSIEHPSVLNPMRHLTRQGWSVVELSVDPAGRVRTDHARNVITRDVTLVSVMLANNETGSLQDVRAIADLAHACDALMHVDAAQAVGKVPVDVNTLGADLLTLAGHKFYAPKGIGALYVRTGVALEPIQYGAGHERGLRPGTENVPCIVALGEAARLVRTTLAQEAPRMTILRDRLHAQLAAAIPGLSLNGHPSERLPNTLNVSFPATAGWNLLGATPALAASTGSACHAGGHATSGVLAAMGLGAEIAAGAVRLSLGRFTTEAEIGAAASALINAWRKLAG